MKSKPKAKVKKKPPPRRSSAEPAPTRLAPLAATADPVSVESRSPLLALFLAAAAAFALLSIALAAVPITAFDRLLGLDAHWRTEQLAIFVDDHRLDIAIVGGATLIVAAVIAMPTVTG